MLQNKNEGGGQHFASRAQTQFALLELGLCEKSVAISLTGLLRAQQHTGGAGATPLGAVGTSVLRSV